jgi:predicted TIM-barrel fold metal-dependent hydrolase
MLNRYMAQTCEQYRGRVTGMATVFPGEPDAEAILQEAFDAGLGGLKLHTHVQCFDLVSAALYRLYECCQSNSKPIVIHTGREPKSTAYRCDPHELCRADLVERILSDFPGLNICVPHLGFDEIYAYRKLLETYDNLWLDTAMAIADYFPINELVDLGLYRADRIMYGSDFPNIPHAWDRELKKLEAMALPQQDLERILSKNAQTFFNIDH